MVTITLIVVFLASVILTPLVRKFAFAIGAVDVPNDRRVNKKAMPTLGGLAIILSFLIGFVILPVDLSSFWPILVGAFVVTLVGVLDDRFELTAGMKLFGQFLAASVVVFGGNLMINYLTLPLIGQINFGWFAGPFTIIWIIAIMNAINLVDGLDGLAGGISSIVLISIAAMAYVLNDFIVFPLAMVLVAAILGFLIYNFHPASIFMGDTGALFLGYMIGVLSVMGFKNVTFISLIIPIMILGVPFSDTFFAIVRRLAQKKSISEADHSHLHHRLLALGFTHRQTVILIYALSALFAIGAFTFFISSFVGSIMLFILLLLALELLVEFVGWISPEYRPIINFFQKWMSNITKYRKNKRKTK
ncbi:MULTISPECIES: glycosyltransferase family 4 protein [Brochothrix]|uniref:UDP-N-acetylglucosamine:undecaprenyl-P N-acetylglucosaminyl-1-P transferase n=1 Tax=Brochothrix thermosphacta TaxID=2756 RepID=A0A1D2LBQ1_BROTH|nr:MULTISPECIES: MraY family glycosyltransferase [Brochothrix]SLM91848.1 Undecaprenyl-phosphate N-acetylglucosaminyl 1-phosphate transferase [Brachybacterium faecium]ANZ94963.1 undecaprenyl-phosphate alpha-N-acetylglucosaminyl 1-phosphate transferase [Brochothrix thermosphacta]ATF26147.1 undecaprenyl/decaprenyl-phosphate alpha-N-acetylglucosaminyl 1-phosphate transferase [Brochothrix thermosphacta]ATH85486.1 undecaprenyl/decaprenyl-phosphate alpha-N-acetylglucosaminyl 1-phosphate transferase [B